MKTTTNNKHKRKKKQLKQRPQIAFKITPWIALERMELVTADFIANSKNKLLILDRGTTLSQEIGNNKKRLIGLSTRSQSITLFSDEVTV